MIVRNLSVIFFLLICVQAAQYQLEFDWKSNTTSVDMEFCTIVWNDKTIKTLKQVKLAHTVHHEKIGIDFNEGTNFLAFLYFGMKGKILIDNVKITKPPKTINFLVNGDFEIPHLNYGAQYTYSDKIPGWNGYRITMTNDTKMVQSQKSQGLVLNNLAKSINQKISFARTNKYSFRSSIKQEIQNKVSQMLVKKAEMGNQANNLASQIQASVIDEFATLKKHFESLSSSYTIGDPIPPPSVPESGSTSTNKIITTNTNGVPPPPPERPAVPTMPTAPGYPTIPSAPASYV